MKLKTKQSKGFTLIELLVVIAIIAVLATLASPAILGALKKAKITKATGVCTAFEVAVENFESEYNYLPFDGGGTAPSSDQELRSDDGLIAVLAGREDTVNFKQIKFFEQPKPKGSSDTNYKDGMHVSDSTAKLYDPWGEKYYISMDYDLNGELDNPLGSDQIHGKKCLIYSTGPDKEKGDTAKNKDNPSNFK
ncbi:MAG: type II secretion system protein [Akkermansiaceae bacterium]|nr:type II secretion system protein [Akkermansiaceae bacterium]